MDELYSLFRILINCFSIFIFYFYIYVEVSWAFLGSLIRFLFQNIFFPNKDDDAGYVVTLEKGNLLFLDI